MTVVLAHVTDDASIAKVRYVRPGCSNVLARSNDSDLGLTGFVYTGDPHGPLRLTKLPDYGIVALGAPKFAAPIRLGARKPSVSSVRARSAISPRILNPNTSASRTLQLERVVHNDNQYQRN